MKKNNIKKHLHKCKYLLLSLTCMFFGNAIAQDMYISSGATLHYSGGDFASGVIDNNNGGTFSVSADYVHSADNYVDGPTAFLSAGTYDVSLESGANDRAPNFTATSAATVSYDAATAPTGTPPADHTLADAEIYTFTGNISAATATPLAGTGFGGALGDLVVVFANADGETWSTTVTDGTTTVMSFAQQNMTLGIDDAFDAENFSLYPNPVKENVSSINFYLPNNSVNQLDVTMYDYTGKTVKQYKNVPIQNGINSIDKPNVAQGLYLFQFSFNNGEQQTTKKVVIE